MFRAPVEVKAARLHSQLHVGCGIFDTLDTLARMDVGNQPGNSIEEYISSNFPGDARYMHAPLLGSMCKFPPGHRIRIERFVQEMRSSHLCHDLFNDAVPAVATKKKKKNCEPSAVQAPDGGIPATTESTTSIVSRLRQQINEWQRRMSDERLRSLQEDVHYELTVKEEQAVLSCKLCSKNVTLSSKHKKLILSNWTRHINTCFKRPKEHQIDKYFVQNLPLPIDKPCTSKSATFLKPPVPSISSSALLLSTSPTVTMHANSATNFELPSPFKSTSMSFQISSPSHHHHYHHHHHHLVHHLQLSLCQQIVCQSHKSATLRQSIITYRVQLINVV